MVSMLGYMRWRNTDKNLYKSNSCERRQWLFILGLIEPELQHPGVYHYCRPQSQRHRQRP